MEFFFYINIDNTESKAFQLTNQYGQPTPIILTYVRQVLFKIV